MFYIYIYIHTSFPNLMHRFKKLPHLSNLPFPQKTEQAPRIFADGLFGLDPAVPMALPRVRRLLVKFLNFKWVFFFGTFNIISISQWLGMQFIISTFSATVKLEDINFFRGAVKVWSNLTNGCCFPFHLGEWWFHQPDWSLLKDSPTKNYSFWTRSWRM